MAFKEYRYKMDSPAIVQSILHRQNDYILQPFTTHTYKQPIMRYSCSMILLLSSTIDAFAASDPEPCRS